jgi:hypothetical protein
MEKQPGITDEKLKIKNEELRIKKTNHNDNISLP